MQNEEFFKIENIIVIENHNSLRGSPIFLFGRRLGVIRKELYSPHQVGSTVLDNVVGQTTKLIGEGDLLAVPIDCVMKKCVASFIGGDNSYVLTAIPNCFETD